MERRHHSLQGVKHVRSGIMVSPLAPYNLLHGENHCLERKIHHLLDGDLFPRHLSAHKTMMIDKILCCDVSSLRTCQ